jgi:hypothetical protein
MQERDTQDAAQPAARQPWQPLGYEKISAAEAEAAFSGVGADNGFYS